MQLHNVHNVGAHGAHRRGRSHEMGPHLFNGVKEEEWKTEGEGVNFEWTYRWVGRQSCTQGLPIVLDKEIS